jgi:hypothetical protein
LEASENIVLIMPLPTYFGHHQEKRDTRACSDFFLPTRRQHGLNGAMTDVAVGSGGKIVDADHIVSRVGRAQVRSKVCTTSPHGHDHSRVRSTSTTTGKPISFFTASNNPRLLQKLRQSGTSACSGSLPRQRSANASAFTA